MNILSYNVRGFGSVEKRAKVRRLVQEKHPFVLCIQESKLGVLDDASVRLFWGDAPFGFTFQPSASSGLITVWDSSVVEVWYSMSFRHVLVIKGWVVLTNVEFVIVNVYAPCDTVAKQVL